MNLKDFKNSEIVWLIVAFLLGYFARQICSGKVVEGSQSTGGTCILDASKTPIEIAAGRCFSSVPNDPDGPCLVDPTANPPTTRQLKSHEYPVALAAYTEKERADWINERCGDNTDWEVCNTEGITDSLKNKHDLCYWKRW